MSRMCHCQSTAGDVQHHMGNSNGRKKRHIQHQCVLSFRLIPTEIKLQPEFIHSSCVSFSETSDTMCDNINVGLLTINAHTRYFMRPEVVAGGAPRLRSSSEASCRTRVVDFDATGGIVTDLALRKQKGEKIAACLLI